MRERFLTNTHPLYILHYECAKCQTLYDVTWDSIHEQEPASQCPECGSPTPDANGAERGNGCRFNGCRDLPERGTQK